MRNLLGFAALSALLMPGAALADGFITPDDCELADGHAVIPMNKVLARIVEGVSIPIDAADFGTGGSPPLARRVVEAGPCREGKDATGRKCSGLSTIYQNVQWALDEAHGPSASVHLEWRGTGADPWMKDQRRAILLFLRPDNQDYALVCSSAAPPKPQPVTREKAPQHNIFDSLVLAQTVDETAEPFERRKPALLSYKSDRLSKSESYSIEATLLWQDMFRVSDPTYVPNDYRLMFSPYVSLAKKTSKDPAKQVDDFTLGLQLEGRFFRRDTPFYLNASWISDVGHWSSSQYLATFQVDPPLAFLPAYRRYYRAVEDDKFTVLPYWSLSGVADYSKVVHEGAKTSLHDVKQYARLGFDADGGIRLGRGLDSASMLLTTSYQYRNQPSSRSANATLWSFGAEFKPNDTSPFSFSLRYKYGREINTLVPVKELDASIGFKH